MAIETFIYDKRFLLESGQSLPHIEIGYQTFGKLNAKGDNVIWVCHALTANSNVFDWWKGLFGEASLYNPNEYFIVCANNLGSCYGSTGPYSIDPNTHQRWYNYFPKITTRDIANALILFKNHLGIERIHTLIGGSQGGQIAQEFILKELNIAEHLILIATNAQHSPWGIAFNESQRLAIKADRTYYSNCDNGGEKGLQAARSFALLSYRNYNTYKEKQTDLKRHTDNYVAASYQRYQGQKLVNRFNAYSYVRLTEAMDSHDVARSRTSSVEIVLNKITIPTLIIGVSSDVLFPVQEQQSLAKYIRNSFYEEIDSLYGHDGFLIETDQLTNHIANFYNQISEQKLINSKIKKQLAI